jgi:hypothetical protein
MHPLLKQQLMLVFLLMIAAVTFGQKQQVIRPGEIWLEEEL